MVKTTAGRMHLGTSKSANAYLYGWVRQSVPSAEWQLYGRPENSADLVHHVFRVNGKDWQVVRADLRRDAGWKGVLTAFRIDPPKGMQAHVDFERIRLTNLNMAARQPLEMRNSGGASPARLQVNLPETCPLAGSEQNLSVLAADAQGQPLAGVPIRIELRKGCLGELDGDKASSSLKLDPRQRRALTNAAGLATFCYRASRRAGTAADVIETRAEFSTAPVAVLEVTTRPKPVHHYVVTPERTRVLRPQDPPLAVRAQLADEFGNPLPGGGRKLVWETSGGALKSTGEQTAADGGAPAEFTGNPKKCWADRIRVRDDQGTAGQSAYICVMPDGPRPEQVKLLPNNYFAVGGKPWLPLGGFYANWVQVPTPDGEWDRRLSFTDATDEQTVAWLKLLKENGVNAQRFMLRTHRPKYLEPMDLGGRANLDLFAEFLHYLDLARPFGFKFLLVLHEDYDKPVYVNRIPLDLYSIPKFAGEDLDALPACQRKFIRDRDLVAGEKYSDPDAIACQDMYAREVVGLLKDIPSVFAYELENEMVNCPGTWANHALEVIRSVDSQTPICVSHGGGGIHTADPAWWKEKTSIDFYTYHLYPAEARSTLALNADYGAVIDVLTRYGRMGKPAFLGESSGDEFSLGVDALLRRYTMRDIIWFSLANGNPGCFFWNARLSEFSEFKLAQTIAGRIDWTRFQRQRPAIAVEVAHSLEDDKYYRTPEGVAAHTMMCRYAQHYLSKGQAFDFTFDPAPYAFVSKLHEFSPANSTAGQFAIPPGWQLCPLVRADAQEALVYIRNMASPIEQEIKRPGKPSLHLLLRQRKPAPLSVSLPLPELHKATVWDLDTTEARVVPVKTGGSLDLGTSDHDFVLYVEP
ncbi:MAG: Ig-like domain-containing protein [Planctomycetota bacterium]